MSPRSLLLAVTALAALALPGAASARAAGDPLLGRQWALSREGVLGRAAAWERSTGRGALVAVLDTGADLDHPDLRGAFWTNPGEIPGNGIDDDHDGFVDDVHGADVIDGDGDPSDDEGHGTHVAGIIAARANNGVGGAGLAPDAQLMIVKVLDAHRDGSDDTLAAGIRYALAHGARIINASINGDQLTRSLRGAIAQADEAGAVIVASAGNDGRDLDTNPSYPAASADPAVLGVASTSFTGVLSAFSSRGAHAVDLAAPGEDILSTRMGGGYELRSGTSMAAPFVAATLALLQSARPDLGGPALSAALLGSARRMPYLDGLLSTGALDAAGALTGVLGAPVEPLGVRLHVARVTTRTATLAWRLQGDPAQVARLTLHLDGRVAWRRPAGAGSARMRVAPGRHRWRLDALDAAGAPLASSAGEFRVARR